MQKIFIGSILLAGLCAGYLFSSYVTTLEKNDTKEFIKWARVVDNYVAIAQLNYSDSLATALELRTAVKSFVSSPSENSLQAAKKKWKLARKYYQQTEVFRFGNPEVDAWEGKVNAWPLDEGLIDYVDQSSYPGSDNPYAQANIIANPMLSLSGKQLDTTELTPTTLKALHEIDGVESNVATGYHAIEFLLWGQDLNGHKTGPGNRPFSDFDPANCTGGNCARRAKYLTAVTDLLIEDLRDITQQWSFGGTIWKRFQTEESLVSIGRVVTGLGSLSYGELAGERTKLGLLLGDPEEEQDCFSDNTHASHFFNVVGLNNILTGTYQSFDGKKIEGPGVVDLVQDVDPKKAATLREAFAHSQRAAKNLVNLAAKGQTFDVLIDPKNTSGNTAISNFVDALVSHTSELEESAKALGISNIVFESSDSLEK